MDKLWESGGPLRYRHKSIPESSPYHQFYVSYGAAAPGQKRAETADGTQVGISKDEVEPVTPSPDEMNRLARYSDLTDRATGRNWAYRGWDPTKDMVMVEDPEDGNEHWLPRKQLVARYTPDLWTRGQ